MEDIEFNLIDEPWIKVMDSNCHVSEVSLKDALLNAHNYTSLSGELPTQDVAVMRLMLAVLHTVYSRVDEDGNESPLEDDEDEAIERWQALWKKGRFSAKAISDYLEKWHERFWLFHPERPFSQVAGMTDGTFNNAMKLNGELSQSANKKRLFSLCSGVDKESLTYSQAARWLIYLNGYDDIAIKKTKEGQEREKVVGKLPSAKRGWLGQLGLVYITGNNLFETLMSNLVMVCCDVVQNLQRPFWEIDCFLTQERQVIPIPDNLAELYTLPFRLMCLKRENHRVIGCYNAVGYLIEGSAYMEPMTIWEKDKHSEEQIPKKHDSTKYMWNEFEYFFEYTPSDCGIPKTKKAEVLNWYIKTMGRNKRLIRITATSLIYDESQNSSLPVKNVFSDSITMQAELLSELGADWRVKIATEIEKCDKLASTIAHLAQDLYVASGGSNNKKDTHYKGIPNVVKLQLYYRFDIPFRRWLQSIDPEIVDENQKYYKLLEWEEIALKTTRAYAKELVFETPDTAITGHKEGNVLYTSSKAMNKFEYQIKYIYGKVENANG